MTRRWSMWNVIGTGWGETEYHKTCEDHALPPDFEKMEYIEFLKERRLRMAQIVQKAYKKLCE